MYQLLVRYLGWQPGQDEMSGARTFEYTDRALAPLFKSGDALDVQKLMAMPALFATETGGKGPQYARIGTIIDIKQEGGDYKIRYAFDGSLPSIENRRLEKLALMLGIDVTNYEMTRTHWAIKDVDLFAALLRAQAGSLHSPKVFSLSTDIDDAQMSVMMPFEGTFDGVYTAMQECADRFKMQCRRADDIWKHDAVIQDIVSLISRSRVVVCDCSSRNPNVFYEAGIAHTLGRDVILITQSESDIPFNLRHLRYIKYLNNGEGIARLSAQVQERITTILSSPSA
jgi:hypothetical protein